MTKEMTVPQILEDKREIRALRFPDGRTYDTRCGVVRKIVAYGEPAEHCYVPWFAAYDYSNNVIARVPAGMVEVIYV